MLRAFSRDGLEIFVKTGKIVKPALITELLDTDPVIDEQLAGMTYTYFRQELRVGLARSGFKIPAKRIRHQPGDGSHLLQVYLLREMPERIVINGIDTIVLLLGEVMLETDGG